MAMDFGFHDIQLLKDQPLGTGSYGAVCRARCDELLCAAKIVHPSLYIMDGPDAAAKNVPLEKFQQECRLLCAVKHPNIVQYLGTWREPDSGHLVLLMELCDRSLTRYLEGSPSSPVPYHVQVDICHDIALALVYLHRNNLIHRDLSSNNVLLMRDLRAKITDFGMSKFMHHRLTPLTLCPGTLAYMPPESLDQAPNYTHKLDCFSMGVLSIQIVTCKFPDPGERFESIPSPQSPTGFVLQPVSEENRRSFHISLIEESHPFLPLIKQCLSYKEKDRPSALDICRRMAKLKDCELYRKDMQVLRAEASTGGSVLQHNEQSIPNSDSPSTIPNSSSIHSDLLKEKLSDTEKKLKETEILLQETRETATKELKQKDFEIKLMKDKIVEIQREFENSQEIGATTPLAAESNKQAVVATSGASKQDSSLSLSWRTVGKAPQEFTRGGAVVLGTVYCHSSGKNFVSEFNIEDCSWTNLPRCRYSHFGLAAVKGQLTAIGGYDFTTTGKLFTYSTDGSTNKSWVQKLQPMPTPRCSTVCVSTNETLVVAGGDASGYNDYLDVVEVMDIASGKWTEVPRLPQPCLNLSATLCGDTLYLTGGVAPRGNSGTYSCSLSSLLQPPPRGRRFRALSQQRKAVWHEVEAPPSGQTTLVTVSGQILAVGGQNEERKPVTAVYRYSVQNGSWHKFSDLIVPRSRCIAAVFEGGVVCIGGQGENTIEIASCP